MSAWFHWMAPHPHRRRALLRFCVLLRNMDRNIGKHGGGAVEKGGGEGMADMTDTLCKYMKLLRNKKCFKMFLTRKATKQVMEFNMGFVTLQGSQLSNKPLPEKKGVKNLKRMPDRNGNAL